MMRMALLLLLAAVTGAVTPAAGQAPTATHEEKLLRLAEILGAVHHLREICGDNEGQLWRDQMMAVLEVEAPQGQLRGRLVGAFNTSYRNYQRTYGACTTSAKTATDRFLSEGAGISTGIARAIEHGGAGEEAGKTAETGGSPPR